ncbi:hypothetical protein KC19_1G185600 [Ceratodon purpureus]|uniref:Uncharacterized protein n=1 Tax=Ceratodon purpureus TaxID=3225 RepID=A0A8T0J8Q3_CERPU|nr:hypothetical protein KC19_1G185600 [Ceratodon purpureus]
MWLVALLVLLYLWFGLQPANLCGFILYIGVVVQVELWRTKQPDHLINMLIASATHCRFYYLKLLLRAPSTFHLS